METFDLVTQMNKLSEFEARITVVENRMRDRQLRELEARVAGLEQLHRTTDDSD